jgi:hypothetical protein
VLLGDPRVAITDETDKSTPVGIARAASAIRHLSTRSQRDRHAALDWIRSSGGSDTTKRLLADWIGTEHLGEAGSMRSLINEVATLDFEAAAVLGLLWRARRSACNASQAESSTDLYRRQEELATALVVSLALNDSYAVLYFTERLLDTPLSEMDRTAILRFAEQRATALSRDEAVLHPLMSALRRAAAAEA